MALAVGTRLGPYEVTGLLGAGGMGEVYRARDTKLGRAVALKVLPPAFAADPERVARFQREARTLAALNHPHIAQIFGLEETDATLALAMEFVAGEDLATRLTRGPVPLEEAFAIARQVAEALDAAHTAGIVHRDLKPANVVVREDGTVKVLDFGLAKALDANSASATADHSPTITTPAMTAAGVILGTAAYMSPEQARGKPVDKRTDIWAFGCVLYELLTGRRAFEGETVTDVLSAVVRAEPDWTRLPAGTSAPVRALLEATLRKDPATRLRDIGDAPLLADARTAGVSVSPPSPALRIWQRPVVAVAGAVALLALGAGAATMSRTGTTAPVGPIVHLTIDSPPDRSITNRGGVDVVISRDGLRVAYLADGPNGRQIFVRDLGSEDARALAGTEGADDPFFSWDGQSIGFESRSRGALMRIPVAGGRPEPIPGAAGQTRGGWWDADDSIIYGTGSGLWRVPSRGGTPVALVEGVAHGSPYVLPGGGAIVFNRNVAAPEIVVMDLRTQAQTVLFPGKHPHYVSSGHLVFARDNALMAVRFDPTTLTAAGEAVVLNQNVRESPSAAADFAVSADGTLIYMAGTAIEGDRPFAEVDVSGTVGRVLARRPGAAPRVSPDGRWLAYMSDRTLWVVDLSRGTESRVATGLAAGAPAWTPDGRAVTYVRVLPAGFAIDSADLGAAGAPRELWQSPSLVTLGSWSPDGSVLAVATYAPGGDRDLAVLRRDSQVPASLVSTPAMEGSPRFSPDGRHVAYVTEVSGQPQVHVREYPTGASVVVSTDGGEGPVWGRDGRTLYFAGPAGAGLGRLMSVDIDTHASGLTAGIPVVRLPGPYRLSDSGGNALYDVLPGGRGFVMTQLSDAEKREGNSLHIVLNWARELTERLP